MIFFYLWPSCRFLRCLWCVSGSGMESILQRSQPAPCQNQPTLFQNVPKLRVLDVWHTFTVNLADIASRSQPIHVRLLVSKSTQCAMYRASASSDPGRKSALQKKGKGKDQATHERKPNVLKSCKQVSLWLTARFPKAALGPSIQNATEAP